MGFGVHIPTCIRGTTYWVPFAKPSDAPAHRAPVRGSPGFDSVWGNDHMTTQRYVQHEFPDPPNFFEPLITFSYCAARTTRLRFATGIIVLPMRNMPVPRQAGGDARSALGRAASSWAWARALTARSTRPSSPTRGASGGGTIVDEGMQVLRLLFTERKATFRGQHGALRGGRVLSEASRRPRCP